MAKPFALQITEREWLQVSAIVQRYLASYPVWGFGSRVNGTPKAYSIDCSASNSLTVPKR